MYIDSSVKFSLRSAPIQLSLSLLIIELILFGQGKTGSSRIHRSKTNCSGKWLQTRMTLAWTILIFSGFFCENVNILEVRVLEKQQRNPKFWIAKSIFLSFLILLILISLCRKIFNTQFHSMLTSFDIDLMPVLCGYT